MPTLPVLLLLACGPASSTVEATPPPAEPEPVPEVQSPPAWVQSADQQQTLSAPHGKARVTPLARGNEAFVAWLDIDAGIAIPAHRDPTEETIVVIEGSGLLTLDGVEHAIGPGSSVFMPADAEVSFQNGDAPMRVLQVFADPDPSAKYDSWSP